MIKILWIIPAILFPFAGKSQDHGSLEQYYYTGGGASVVVPRIFYQSRKNWIGEIRYNYEELQTVSLNAGKMFSINKTVAYSVTPYGGVVIGRLNGGTVGSNVSMEFKNLFLSCESQYTFSVQNTTENFFFNWSEFGYQLSKLVYAGVALQLTRQYQIKNIWEPGVTMGLTYKNWTFPVYAFNLTNTTRNYVLGINWEWSYGRQKKQNDDLNLIYL